MSDNLYRIFGTHKLFRILSPSFRNVPFTGLEWSFRFKDEGYDCDGFKLETTSNRLLEEDVEEGESSDEDEDIEIIQFK